MGAEEGVDAPAVADEPDTEKADTRNTAAPAPATVAARQPSLRSQSMVLRRGVRYSVAQAPPWLETALFGFQHFCVMLGATSLVPQILVPQMGGSSGDVAKVTSTLFFTSGINTLIQTTLGIRLPILQGASFAFLAPVASLSASIAASQAFDSDADRFTYTMRSIQGGVIASSAFIVAFGALGLAAPLLRVLSPITMAATVAALGLALVDVGMPTAGTCVQLGLPVTALLVLLAFGLRAVRVPLLLFSAAGGGGAGPGPKPAGAPPAACRRRWRLGRYPVFQSFPVLLAVFPVWLYAYVMTVAGVYDDSAAATQQSCTTWASNTGDLVARSDWFRVPYPGQWGWPVFTADGVFTMLAGAIPAAAESLGDYFAAARAGGAPTPVADAVGRGVAAQGVACLVNGLWGTAGGSTSYSENVATLAVTGVGSRRTMQAAGVVLIVLGVIGKAGAVFASMPLAMVAGLWVFMFSLITLVGVGFLAVVDLTDVRNTFVFAFSTWFGLSTRIWFVADEPVDTGNSTVNNILNSWFSTAAAVALTTGLLLDNLLPGGTREGRGLAAWRAGGGDGEWWLDPELERVYGWPAGLSVRWKTALGAARRRVAGGGKDDGAGP